jgi:hypothetical protein
MTNDKSAVLTELREAIREAGVKRNTPRLYKAVMAFDAALHQPTQSDALKKAAAALLTDELSKIHTDGSRSCGQPVTNDKDSAEYTKLLNEIRTLRWKYGDQAAELAVLVAALKAAPLIGRTESAKDFRARQDAWLKRPYRAALQKQSK